MLEGSRAWECLQEIQKQERTQILLSHTQPPA